MFSPIPLFPLPSSLPPFPLAVACHGAPVARVVPPRLRLPGHLHSSPCYSHRQATNLEQISCISITGIRGYYTYTRRSMWVRAIALSIGGASTLGRRPLTVPLARALQGGISKQTLVANVMQICARWDWRGCATQLAVTASCRTRSDTPSPESPSALSMYI